MWGILRCWGTCLDIDLLGVENPLLRRPSLMLCVPVLDGTNLYADLLCCPGNMAEKFMTPGPDNGDQGQNQCGVNPCLLGAECVPFCTLPWNQV